MFLLSGFILGLASTFHCIGMCGPIALALPLPRTSPLHRILGLSSYHFGRIITYSLLGAFIGIIGFSLQLFHVFQLLSIVFGVLLIAIAWRKKWIHTIRLNNSGLNRFIAKGMAYFMHSDGSLKLFGLGLLNGLLPCGMTFIALGTALLASDYFGSIGFMCAFGLGTFPGLFLVNFFSQRMNHFLRVRMKAIFPVFLTVVGLSLVLRGANLGIPYLSPKLVTPELTKKHTKTPIKLIQCH